MKNSDILIKTFLMVIFFILSGLVFAQPSELWMKTYYNPNGTGYDYSDKSVIDASGNIYVVCATRTANTSDDIMLLKYNSSGTFLWSKTYNYSYNGIEQPNDICLDQNGNIYITGTSTRAQGSFDCILLKFDPSGNIIWVKRINKTNYADRECEGISLAYRDGIYVGVNFDYNGWSESGIAKYSSNGDSIAYIQTGFLQNYTYRMIKMVQDNQLNLYAVYSGDLLPNEEEDFAVKKINTNGSLTQVWSKIFTGASHLDDRANDIAVGPDGNIFVAGYTKVNNQGYNTLLLKYGRDDGSVIFQKTYNNNVNNQDDYANFISFDDNSNIIIGGGSYSLNAPSDMLFIKYSPAGSQLWTKIYDHTGSRYDWIRDMVTDDAGNIYFAAECFDQVNQNTALLTGKLSQSGEVDWVIERSGQTTGQSIKSLDILADGTLIMAGNTEEAGVKKTLLVKYGSTIGIQPISNNTPGKFELSQNYPNPFNPVTNIEFSIPVRGNVKLSVYDERGREAAVLVNSSLEAGTYKADFNAGILSSGIYFYKLTANDFTETKKMILVK